MARGLGVEIACFFNDAHCVENAVLMYNNWMNNPDKL